MHTHIIYASVNCIAHKKNDRWKITARKKEKKIDKNNNATNWVTGCEARACMRGRLKANVNIIWFEMLFLCALCTQHNLLLTAVLLLYFNCYKWTHGGWREKCFSIELRIDSKLWSHFLSTKNYFLLKINSKSTIQIIICICSFSRLVFIIQQILIRFFWQFFLRNTILLPFYLPPFRAFSEEKKLQNFWLDSLKQQHA